MARYGAREMNERKRRARAAWAYSGMQQDELADAAGIPAATLRGYLGRSRSSPDRDVLIAIADAAGVPAWFADHGFDPPADIGEPATLDP